MVHEIVRTIEKSYEDVRVLSRIQEGKDNDVGGCSTYVKNDIFSCFSLNKRKICRIA